jgi:hypothetical protein
VVSFREAQKVFIGTSKLGTTERLESPKGKISESQEEKNLRTLEEQENLGISE